MSDFSGDEANPFDDDYVSALEDDDVIVINDSSEDDDVVCVGMERKIIPGKVVNVQPEVVVLDTDLSMNDDLDAEIDAMVADIDDDNDIKKNLPTTTPLMDSSEKNAQAKSFFSKVIDRYSTPARRTSSRLKKRSLVKQNKLINFKPKKESSIDSDNENDDLLFEDDEISKAIRTLNESEKNKMKVQTRDQLRKLIEEKEEELIVDDLESRCGKIGLTVKDYDRLITDVLQQYRSSRDFIDPDEEMLEDLQKPIWGERDFHIFSYLGDEDYLNYREENSFNYKRRKRSSRGSRSKDDINEISSISEARSFILGNGVHLDTTISKKVYKFLFDILKYDDNEEILKGVLDVVLQDEEIRYQEYNKKSKGGNQDSDKTVHHSIIYLVDLLGEISGNLDFFNEIISSNSFPPIPDDVDTPFKISNSDLYEEIIPDFTLPTAKIIKIICYKLINIFKSNATLENFLQCLKIILTCCADVNIHLMSVDLSIPLMELFEYVSINNWDIQDITKVIYNFLLHPKSRWKFLNLLKQAISIAPTECSQLIHTIYHTLSLVYFLNPTENYSLDITNSTSDDMGDTILKQYILPQLEKEALFNGGGLSFLHDDEVTKDKYYEFSFLVESFFYQLPYITCERTHLSEVIQNREKALNYFRIGMQALETRVNNSDLYCLFATLELCRNFIEGSYSITIPLF